MHVVIIAGEGGRAAREVVGGKWVLMGAVSPTRHLENLASSLPSFSFSFLTIFAEGKSSSLSYTLFRFG